MFAFLEEFNTLHDDKITLIICEKVQGNNVLLPFYYYDIYENCTNQCIGKISIRIGDNYHSYYNGHIGYEIDENYRGKHYSYYAIMLVIEVAKAHQMKSIYLTCKESNVASRKIIEKTNAKLIEITKIPKDCFFWRVGIEDSCIYTLKL
nr:GNAT family N-acetyltransferase [uncultured Niameybacter sp.]